eukprot:4364113-Pleurochrysis_carterae.AAC.12
MHLAFLPALVIGAMAIGLVLLDQEHSYERGSQALLCKNINTSSNDHCSSLSARSRGSTASRVFGHAR